jgi:hypothetical protein
MKRFALRLAFAVGAFACFLAIPLLSSCGPWLFKHWPQWIPDDVLLLLGMAASLVLTLGCMAFLVVLVMSFDKGFWLWLPVFLLFPAISPAAQYQTPNFAVDAPTAQIAEQVCRWAEYYRKQKAVEWLGQEMPRWGQRCPLHVKITFDGAGGATQFNFVQGQVYQTMNIEGPLDRVIASILPHEITHTVFAHHFRQPLPRWADEGGAVLSEDQQERDRHDQMVRQILNSGRYYKLPQLFSMKDYPSAQWMGHVYAEGYSVSAFLVSCRGRAKFLEFVALGMQQGWDAAGTAVYGQDVKGIEYAWLYELRRTKHVAAAAQPASPVAAPQQAEQPQVNVRLPDGRMVQGTFAGYVRAQPAAVTEGLSYVQAAERQMPPGSLVQERGVIRPARPGERPPSTTYEGSVPFSTIPGMREHVHTQQCIGGD